MAYYNTIKSPNGFMKAASSRKAVSFAMLQQSRDWEGGVSRWSVDHLFACRVICKQPSNILPLLAHRIESKSEVGIHSCIDNLIQGPREELRTLKKMSELQIVRAYELESLGYVWAALAPLIEPESESTMASERPVRKRTQTDRGEYVPSEGFQISSSPLDRPNTASSVPSSVGYIEKSSAPLMEEFTIRFLSCLLRCVLNYAQPVDKTLPFIQYRDQRLRRFEAIDDGGVQLIYPDRNPQLVILEAKRNFQEIIGGSPTVSDELLAQVVGEALALKLSENESVSQDECVDTFNFSSFHYPFSSGHPSFNIVLHYIKIFHLCITDIFIDQFRTLVPTERSDEDTYLNINSTGWFDYLVRHLLALIDWADNIEVLEDLENPLRMELDE
ncbi:hypothetical protein F5884DRAFT_818216 [Xylogone sp. PMI_703]|nr:hypothetical protein F5884DRAFT_818216 [Xylogone sp. PMI_703]